MFLVNCMSRRQGRKKKRPKGSTYLFRLSHQFLSEGSINDKVSIIADHRSSLHLTHTQAKTRLTVGKNMWGAHVGEVGEDFGVRKGDDFDGNSFSPLLRGGNQFNRGHRKTNE